MLEIEGYISNIVFRNEENLFTVMVFETEDGDITAVGNLPSADPGQHYVLTGNLVYHDKYGEQFLIETAQFSMPKSKRTIEKYLASGIFPHIGKATAKRIVNKFGEDALEIMEENPERLKEIRGLGKVKIKAISQAVEENKASRESILYLQELGFGPSQAAKIYSEYKGKTISMVKTRPYQLIDDIPGIGFNIADRTALKSGFSPQSKERILAAGNYILDMSGSQNGDTYMDKESFIDQIEDLLRVDRSLVEKYINEKIISGKLIQKYKGDRPIIYSDRLFEAEELASTRLVQIYLEDPSFSDIYGLEDLDQTILDEDQKHAVREVFSSKISVITGGPGTGKTSIVNAIVDIADKNNLSYLLAAPTGRAAKRLEESTGKKASTIHRLLKFYSSEDGFESFDHDYDNPLKADLIIIDEASMIDIDLLANLTNALTADTSLVFVGDVNQLPSVGPGNVLEDIIGSGIARTLVLKKIYRQDENSMIVTNAHRINQGLMPIVNEGKDFFFIDDRLGASSQENFLDLIKRRLASHYQLDPITDIQVLTPMKKGELGTKELNAKLQGALNPDRGQNFIEIGDSVFRPGDKVMQQKNNYQMEYTNPDGTKDQGVFNGDMGMVRDIQLGKERILVEFDDERKAYYNKENISELMHAYAITVHKSQGSEFKAVVIPIFPGPYMLLTRNLIYTAVTRAKDLLVMFGDRRVLKQMIDNNKISERNSSLDMMIREKLELFKGVL